MTIPASVSFSVTDVTIATGGTPSPATASFEDAVLASGDALRMSIQADATNFTRPVEAGGYIPASNLSWTINGATNGQGFAGTLSATAYTEVYESNPDATSGSVNLVWSLAAPGGGVRAGAHMLTATWKIESVVP